MASMASYDDGMTQGILPPVGRKRSRPEGLVSPMVHKFKLFHPKYDQWHEETILRLHADGTCTTEQAPDKPHGSWFFTENGDLRVSNDRLGDSSKVKNSLYRKIEKTECWELVDYGKVWYSMLLPSA
jgi:hypothetical protein